MLECWNVGILEYWNVCQPHRDFCGIGRLVGIIPSHQSWQRRGILDKYHYKVVKATDKTN